MRLNKEQYRAAHHISGPMLVLAGPGSGKTHLLVERIRMMIEERHIPPDNILVITFSKKAARQMQARFEKRVEGRIYPVIFGTFHAVFYHILRTYDPNINRLITGEEQKKYVTELIGKSQLFDGDTEADEVIGMISSYKNLSNVFFARCETAKDMDESQREDFVKLVGEYERLCRNAGVIDFDDMILLCRQVFEKHEMFLRKWQQKYRYFLVDEFQDINEGQYDVLRLLAGDSMNVFAVGDDDQSIYAFRGSRPELMKRFIRQYRNCAVVNLLINYRCSSNIIGTADTLIRHNTDRIQRPMQKCRRGAQGGEVVIVHSENTTVQAAFVCDMIDHLKEKHGYGDKDFAVLYRSAHCAVMFENIAKQRHMDLSAINLMTVHASKGLEFTCVFVIGLQEGQFPHHRSMSDELVSEERRLMYVAMTRARQRLYLCTLGAKNGKPVSRFAKEICERKKYIADRLQITRC